MAAPDHLTPSEIARILNRFGPEGFDEDVQSLFEDYFGTRPDNELDDSDHATESETGKTTYPSFIC